MSDKKPVNPTPPPLPKVPTPPPFPADRIERSDRPITPIIIKKD